MKLAALLFDVDGTLVDTEELHRRAYNQTFLEFGLPWEWGVNLYAELLGISGGAERIGRYIDLIDLPAAEKTRLRRIIPNIHREKARLYGELVADKSVRLRPGVARLIEEARGAGLRIGFAASSASATVHSLLSAAFGRQAGEVADATVCADEVTRKKPAPDIYELLLTVLRVPAGACVAFEDSANGITAAKAAGLFTVVTPTRWTQSQDLADADLLLPSLGDPDETPEGATASAGRTAYLELSKLDALRLMAERRLHRRESGM